jgi:hypothetical protein
MSTRSPILFLPPLDLAIAVGFFWILYVVYNASQPGVVRAEAKEKHATAQCNVSNPVSPGGCQLATPSDQMVRQELLGIHGSLKHLVFVVDKSGSMTYGGKWEYVRGVIDTWLRYLDVEHCALVVFDDKVSAFPSNGAYLDLTGPNGASNREWLLARLAELKPGGNTNTLAALQRAYALNPGAIVLATDGFPDSGSNRFDIRMAKQVTELCRAYGHSVPIHVLALGNYFRPRLGKFLWSLADTSGGTFLAR